MPFADYTFKIGAQWLHFDVGAGLYSWLADYAYVFEPRELDAYDHLFLGTHLCVDILTEKFLSSSNGKLMRALVQTHRVAQEDYRRLRGLWRQQEQDFQSRAWDFQALSAAGAFSMARHEHGGGHGEDTARCEVTPATSGAPAPNADTTG